MMAARQVTRRQVLIESGAVLAALTTAGVARTAAARAGAANPAVPAPRGGAPAAAAGSITLGGTLKVNRLGFGAMRIMGPGNWGEPKDRAGSLRLLRRALELGVNFIDTADAYGPEVSERLIFEALHPYPADLVIATKGGAIRPVPHKWGTDGRPEHLRAACEASMQRLHLQQIKLYQLHNPDPKVPIEDSIGELGRLQKEGKILHIGVSNVTLAQLQRARAVAKIVSVQNRYNVADRSSEAVLQYCESEQLAFLPYSPLALAEREAAAPPAALQALAQLAARRSINMPQAAIAWLLARSPIMLPIPGTSSVLHLEENVAAASVRFTPAEVAQIG
jgi:pyridoxine 4-dehydrogenase